MSFFNALRSWVLGVDLEQTQADIQAADAAHGVLNNANIQDGIWDDRDAAVAAQHRADGQLNVEAEVGAEFVAGWNEAQQDMTGQLRSGLAAPVNFILKSLPWWAWVGLLVYAFWWLGGFRRFAGALAK